MGQLKLGNILISDFKFGNLQVNAIYIGFHKIFPSVSHLTLSESVISDTFKRFVVGIFSISQNVELRFTLISKNFANDGVTRIRVITDQLLFNVNDTVIVPITVIGGVTINASVLMDFSTSGDTATVKCELIYTDIDAIPTPDFINISFNIP